MALLLDDTELVTNGDFADWTADDPDGWSVIGESGNDPEISEAATGEAHVDTPTLGGGMYNIYTSDGTVVYIQQTITVVPGRRYLFSIDIDTITSGALKSSPPPTGDWTNKTFTSTGITTFTFVAQSTSLSFLVCRNSGATDITVASISIKAIIETDLSRTGQQFSSSPMN